jgi:hypothetical protein
MAAEHRPRLDPEADLRRLGELARRAGSGEVSAHEHARGRERLLREVAQKALPLAPRPWWLMAAAAVPALALVFAVALRPAPELSFAIDGVPPSDSYVAAGPDGATTRFSEGTTVRFAPGARGRIEEVTSRGARVRLEQGGAHFVVAHLPRAAWTAEAGPFTVSVTGTEFDLDWQKERLELVMQRGSVVVRGPMASAGIALQDGQHLVADLARGALTIAEPKAAAAVEAPRASTALAEPAPSPRENAVPLPPPCAGGCSAAEGTAPARSTLEPSAPATSAGVGPARGAAPTLRDRVARGEFASVIAEAEARGLDAALNASSLGDLAALSDAARYAGRADLAERALLAERSRFPGSGEARSAAFLLGRMAEATSPSAAIAWYDRYLAESPAGSLASEALGRKMVVVKASAGRDAARPIAEEYRRRYPEGAFTAVAGEILAIP